MRQRSLKEACRNRKGEGFMEQDEINREAKSRRLRMIIILVAGLCAVGMFFYAQYARPYIEKKEKARLYYQGMQAIQEEKYEKALQLFEKLGKYRRSEYMAHFATAGVTYLKGKAAMDAGQYSEAREFFLNGFRDANVLYEECKKAEAYEKAVSYMKEGRYNEARDSLKESGNYPDTEGVGERCARELAAEDVERLMEEKQYEEAYRILSAGYADSIPEKERAKLLEMCSKEADYASAVRLYGQQEYYSAYVLFQKLGSFRYAKRFMDNCISDKPVTGEIYHDPQGNVGTDSFQLTIKPPADDGCCNCVKIYAVKGSSEKIVSCLFIGKGETVSVNLPAGQYTFNVAYADEEAPWFGVVEMFGPSGNYSRLKMNGSEVFTFETGRTYTLKLREN